MTSISLTGIDAVQVVQIWSEAESFDRALDVFLDVGRGIGDFPVAAVHTVESTF